MKIARFFCVSCFTASVRLEGLLGANAASEQSPAIPTFCTSTFFFWLGGITFAFDSKPFSLRMVAHPLFCLEL